MLVMKYPAEALSAGDELRAEMGSKAHGHGEDPYGQKGPDCSGQSGQSVVHGASNPWSIESVCNKRGRRRVGPNMQCAIEDDGEDRKGG